MKKNGVLATIESISDTKDSPNNMNLIDKTSKQIKYNQRHWNKEQTNSNQRGRGRGIMKERRGRVIGWFLYVPWSRIKPLTLAFWVNAITNWATWPELIYNYSFPTGMIAACSIKCEKILTEKIKHFILATLTPVLNSKQTINKLSIRNHAYSILLGGK